jgi:hypothetical protein
MTDNKSAYLINFSSISEPRNAYNIFAGKPNVRRQLGRHMNRWEEWILG